MWNNQIIENIKNLIVKLGIENLLMKFRAIYCYQNYLFLI